MEIWELVARERIRDSLARYNWSGDAMRLDELVGAFCPDGVLEVRKEEPKVGRAAIIEFLGGVAPGSKPLPADAPAGTKRIVRHNLTNVRFLEVTPERARVGSYFTVVTEIGLDHYGRYRDASCRSATSGSSSTASSPPTGGPRTRPWPRSWRSAEAVGGWVWLQILRASMRW